MHPLALNRYALYLSRANALLAIVCAVCVFLYGIFLLMAVAHTAARTTAQHQITKLSAALGDLEERYLSQERSLTPEYAQTLGFVAPAHVSSVYAARNAPTLTINKNR